MITFFTTARDLAGVDRYREVNAVTSWLNFHPAAEVIIFCQSALPSALSNPRLRLISKFAANQNGLPLLDDLFAQAESRSVHSHLAYGNADILLLDGLTPLLNRLQNLASPALVSCESYNLAVDGPVADAAGWAALPVRARRDGISRGRSAMDFFLFRRGALGRIPPYIVGRAGWDNALPSYAAQHGVAFIDASPGLRLVHQAHDYNHLPSGVAEVYMGVESAYNRKLAGSDSRYLFTLDDADLIWDGQTLVAPQSIASGLRQRQTQDIRGHGSSASARAAWRRLKLMLKVAPPLGRWRARQQCRKNAARILAPS